MRPSPTLPGMLKTGAPKLVFTFSLVRSPSRRKRINWLLPPASSLT